MKISILHTISRIAVLFTGIAAGATSAFCDTPLHAQFDFDKDGQLSKTEVYAGLQHKALVAKKESPDKFLAKHTAKPPQKIEDLELGADLPTIEILYAVMLQDKQLADRPPFPLSTFQASSDFYLHKPFTPPPSKAELAEMEYLPSKPKLMLRRNKDETSLPSDDDLINMKKGALISFSRNYLTDVDQWNFRGALMLQFDQKVNPAYVGELPPITEQSLLLYSALDKVDTGGSDKGEVDSLSFGFQAGRLVNTDFIDYRLSANLDINTDTDWEHLIYSAAVDIDLYRTEWALGGYVRVPLPGLPFLTGWSLKGHLEAGTVEDPGTSEKLVDDDFFRAGGKASIIISPEILEHRIFFEASYLHYETFGSDLDSPSYFEFEGRYRLTPRHEFPAFLVLNYRKGVLEKTLEDDDTVTIGLAVAF